MSSVPALASDEQHFRGHVSIPVQPEQIWKCLTTVESWQKWWIGHRLVRVEPRWEKGAQMIWEPGAPSTICEYEPGRLLGWCGTALAVTVQHTFEVRPDPERGVPGPPRTLIFYDEMIKGARELDVVAAAAEGCSAQLQADCLGRFVKKTSWTCPACGRSNAAADWFCRKCAHADPSGAAWAAAVAGPLALGMSAYATLFMHSGFWRFLLKWFVGGFGLLVLAMLIPQLLAAWRIRHPRPG
jgi:hypothetical protein